MEACQRYSDFFSRFPQAPEAEYALYQEGRIALDMKEQPSIEPLNTRTALQALNRYLQIYPTGAHAGQVREGIRECRNQLAAHEMEVAQYYFKRKAYRATLGRLEYLQKTYPEFDRMRDVFMLYARVYQMLGDPETARRYSGKAAESVPPPTTHP